MGTMNLEGSEKNHFMDTRIVEIKQDVQSDEALKSAGEVIRNGGLVAFPTETVYGLGGDALNPESSKKIYAAKGRPSDNPLIVHICRVEDMYEIAEKVPKEAIRIAEAFWPGPLSMILPKAKKVPFETTGGLDTVAIRFPSHPVAQKLIAYSGGFIAAPSANLSGRPSPTEAKHVIEDLQGRVDVILDGGEVGIGLESTVIDLTVSPPQILRPGYITEEMLREVLGTVDSDVTILDVASGQKPKAPGMKYRHYAPQGELVIVQGLPEQVVSYINEQTRKDRKAGEAVGVIATEETRDAYFADVIKSVGRREDEESIARNLFAILRDFDDAGVKRIYSESFEAEGLGVAIMNRLLKAAGHTVVKLPEK